MFCGVSNPEDVLLAVLGDVYVATDADLQL